MKSTRNAFVYLATRALMSAALACSALPAMSAIVSYQATDLLDTTPGEDLWQLEYTVTGTLAQFNAVNILFAPGSFAAVSVASNSAPALLDAAPVIQPDPGFGVDGMLTLTALSNLSSGFSGKVGVSFVWLASGTPGSQTFELLDDTFNVTSKGQTSLVSAVPEPAVVVQMLAALAVVAGVTARRRGVRLSGPQNQSGD